MNTFSPVNSPMINAQGLFTPYVHDKGTLASQPQQHCDHLGAVFTTPVTYCSSPMTGNASGVTLFSPHVGSRSETLTSPAIHPSHVHASTPSFTSPSVYSPAISPVKELKAYDSKHMLRSPSFTLLVAPDNYSKVAKDQIHL
eukprot:TRINITY_DN1822_c0_g1_i1.p1 TRINITY_DN1822_c0_g1~~TRINITY_DN1822_c0_g1_i1.p1  ORF type:complete len:163 (+),score=27.93 TRINITY_DN1822_c0_g1_i1:66-491(+)